MGRACVRTRQYAVNYNGHDKLDNSVSHAFLTIHSCRVVSKAVAQQRRRLNLWWRRPASGRHDNVVAMTSREPKPNHRSALQGRPGPARGTVHLAASSRRKNCQQSVPRIFMAQTAHMTSADCTNFASIFNSQGTYSWIALPSLPESDLPSKEAPLPLAILGRSNSLHYVYFTSLPSVPWSRNVHSW